MIRKKIRYLILHAALAALAITSSPVRGQDPSASETKEHKDARMAWWREARFGMFIHWGVYSVPAGSWNGKPVWGGGEWIMNCGEIPVADYLQLPKQFNPVRFNAKEWVGIAKAAGMKYIVITAKHHDGFAMFKSEASPFNIVDATPFKRDVLKELAEACREAGIKLGFYYSQSQDWTHPGGTAIKINKRATPHWDKAQDGSTDEYVDKIAVPQIKELLTHYGEFPTVIWFDTSNGFSRQNSAKIYAMIRQYKPDIIMNNRLGGGFSGDTETPEQHIPPQGYPGRDWETCMTMNGTWGFKKDDSNWKPTEKLIRNLCDIASKGGNYLLNVGPTGEGLIPQPSVERLAQVGQWLKTNGEAIYGTGPTPFGAETGEFSKTKTDKKGKPVFDEKWEWRCTTRPGRLYFHIFRWPSGPFMVPVTKAKASKAYLLADPGRKPLACKNSAGGIEVALPASAPDPVASVLCVETEGEMK